jgi:ComF family protein
MLIACRFRTRPEADAPAAREGGTGPDPARAWPLPDATGASPPADARDGAGGPSTLLGPTPGRGWPRLKLTLVAAGNAVLGLVFAPRCAACQAPLDHPLDGPICAPCWGAIRLSTPPLCATCGDPLSSWRTIDAAGQQCPRCRRTPRLVSRARALGPYEGALRSIVHAIKYDGRRSAARRLSHRMRDHAGDLLSGVDAAVPVPLHRSRTRERGFNQAVDLAAGLGVPLAHGLVRVRATPPQADLPEAQRHRNVRDAFAATRALARYRGAVLLLVDDVSTTGATLESCAAALIAAGAGEVRALTAARAVRRQR